MAKTLKSQRFEFMFNKVKELTGDTKRNSFACDYFEESTPIWINEYRDSGNDELFYDRIEYLWGCLGSYYNSSKGYIPKIKTAFEKMNYVPKTVLDFGAGVGLATYDLAELLSNTTVYYYNISEIQTSLFKEMLKQFPIDNIVIIDDPLSVNAEVVFCSEFFEHIKTPEDALKYIMGIPGVKHILEASSFRFSDVAGHYETFIFDNVEVSCNDAQKNFNKLMRRYGFQLSNKVYNVSCWNNRPNIWVKGE